MKRLSLWWKVLPAVLILTVLALSVMAGMASMAGKMAAKGKEVTMTGKMTCTFCTLSHSGQACPKGCCASCVKAGDPPLLVDAAGNMYLLTANEMQGKFMTPQRMAMAGQKVIVKGLLVKGKGIQAIFVDSIKKAAK